MQVKGKQIPCRKKGQSNSSVKFNIKAEASCLATGKLILSLRRVRVSKRMKSKGLTKGEKHESK